MAEMIYWVPRLLFTLFVIVMSLYIIRTFITTSTNVSNVEANIVMNMPYFVPNGFSLNDAQIGRVFPGIVSLSSFNTPTVIENLLKRDNPNLVGMYVVNQTAIDLVLNPKPNPPLSWTIFTDSQRYIEWQPIAQAQGKGEGSKTSIAEVRYVVLDNGKGALVKTIFLAPAQ